MQVDGKPTRTIWLEADGRSVGIIDQTKLPHHFVTLRLTTLEDAAHAIASMQVRGAPLIGAAAAYGVALAQALLLPNWIAGLSGFVGFGILFFGRVGREEEMMMQGFGEEYRTYMAHTARVVPWIY